jgi:hypothetical protein
VLAEDSVVLREGMARLLEDSGFEIRDKHPGTAVPVLSQ